VKQSDFDIAMEHPYECKCKLCEDYWKELPPEEDDYIIYDDEEMKPF
jgi:hypothetical protein